MVVLFPSFTLYVFVYGALIMTGLGSLFLMFLLWRDYKSKNIW